MDVRFVDRSDRSKIRISGEQAAWFLDQILTQSIGGISSGEARDAAMITVKGRMRFFFEIVARAPDDLLAHLEPGLAPAALEEMQRYVFATRVQLEDVTAGSALALVVGERWRELVGRLNVPGAVLHPTLSFGRHAAYIWVDAADRHLLLGRLAEVGGQRIDEDELEALRIESGAPRWGVDMDETNFPQEAGIDGRAVHYQKGCYLGQEAMAKIHFRGKVNRRLARLIAEDAIEPGSEILVGGEKVGTVTSASGNRGLGYVKHTVQAGSEVVIGRAKASVES